ncbi:MAG: hypothetical protein Q9217_003782 [Psora testacea]
MISPSHAPILQARTYRPTPIDTARQILPTTLTPPLSSVVDGDERASPFTAPPTPTAPSPLPLKQLDVVPKRGGEGKIIYLSPRKNHFTTEPDPFAEARLCNKSVEDLRAELEHVLRPENYEELEETRDYLRVAVGNMLERIICWDRESAVLKEERAGFKVLSIVPKADTISEHDAKHLVKQFRKAINTLRQGDWRLFWADLEESELLGLLYYTFLLSRPILAWEIDLDNV